MWHERLSGVEKQTSGSLHFLRVAFKVLLLDAHADRFSQVDFHLNGTYMLGVHDMLRRHRLGYDRSIDADTPEDVRVNPNVIPGRL
jgi:hypothetical protein